MDNSSAENSKPNQSETPILLKLVLLLLITGPFVLYWLEYIMKDNLNRTGIILNFLAGFFLAPDLIGIRRLQSVENKVEALLDKALKSINDFEYSVTFGFLSSTDVLIFALIHYAIIGVIGYVLYWINSWVSLLLGLLLIIFTIFIKEVRKTFTIFLYLSPTFLKLFLLFLVSFPIEFINRKLRGDDQLKSVLVYWGIVLFIMGNLMQFVATF